MRATVLFDFIASTENELTAKEGDIVDIQEIHDDGWSTCVLGEEVGYIPSAFMQLLEDPDMPEQEDDSQQEDDSSLQTVDSIDDAQEESAVLEEKPATALDKKQLTPEERKERERVNLIKELIETERTYVRLICKFVEVFIVPVQKSNYTLVDQQTAKMLFMNMEQISKINQQILLALENSNDNVGHVFKTMAHFLKVYTDYVNNFDNARATYRSLIAKDSKLFNQAFSDIVKQALSNPGLEKNPFDSLLILPVQRIPRYEMLLKNLLKVTPESNNEYNNIKIALENICQIAKFVNESKRTKDNQQILISLANQIKTVCPQMNIILPHRKYLLDGVFKLVKSSIDVSDDSLMLYLFTDIIIIKSAYPKNKKHNWFFAYNVYTQLEKSSSSNEFSLQFLNNGIFVTFHLRASSPEVQRNWEEHIAQQLAQTHNAKVKSVRKELEPVELFSMAQRRASHVQNVCIKNADLLQIDQDCSSLTIDYQRCEAEQEQIEAKIRSLMDDLEKAKLKKRDAEMALQNTQNVKNRIELALQESSREIAEQDEIFLLALSKDVNAFVQVFNAMPIVLDEKGRLQSIGAMGRQAPPVTVATEEKKLPQVPKKPKLAGILSTPKRASNDVQPASKLTNSNKRNSAPEEEPPEAVKPAEILPPRISPRGERGVVGAEHPAVIRGSSMQDMMKPVMMNELSNALSKRRAPAMLDKK